MCAQLKCNSVGLPMAYSVEKVEQSALDSHSMKFVNFGFLI